MAVTSVTAIVKGFVVDGSTPANNNTFYIDFFGNDGSYSSSVSVNTDITQTAQQVANALATAVATAVNTALGTSLTADNVLMLTRPSAGVGTSSSGDIASGSIGAVQIASGGLLSGALASGSVGNVHIASGGLGSGTQSSGSIGNVHIGSGGLGSGAYGSGQIASGHMSTAFILGLGSTALTSGQVTSGFLGDASVVSGSIASGQIASGHLASGTVLPNYVTSGGITSGMLGDASVVSGSIASGQVAGWHLASGVLNAISGTVNISGALISNKYVMGFDLSLNPVVGNQSVIMTWWGMQLRGNQQSPVDVASGQVEPIGPNSEFSVGIPNQQPGSVGLAIISASGQTGDLTAWYGSGGRSGGALGVKYAAINASGEFRGLLASGVVLSGSIASGQIGKFHFASGGIVQSGSIGSGATQGQRGGGFINIASGSIGHFDFGSGAIQSGEIASGQIGQFHHASGSVTSGHIGNNAVVSGSIASGSIGGFAIASGAVQSGEIGDQAVASGTIASGQVGLIHLNSGLQQTLVQYLTDTPGAITNLALDQSFICAELISGLKAVTFASGGATIVRATWGSGLRMPAIGVTISGAVSGTACTVRRYGMVFENVSGQIASGFAGRGLYVGSGGLIVNLSGYVGGASSGAGPGQLSGTATQIIGQAMSGGIMVNPDQAIRSGLVTIAGISY